MKTDLPNLYSLIFIILVAFQYHGVAQNRTIDGFGNNPFHEDWGATATPQLMFVTPAFEDEISEPSGKDRPNPRIISNTLCNQVGDISDPDGRSDFIWMWGQFIDHDITLVPEDHGTSMDIPVPAGDAFFDPFYEGDKVIPFPRSVPMPGSGTDPENCMQFPNMITSYIDASTVYGSEPERANWLRTFEGGKLKMSEGGFLPYNTYTGEKDSPVDATAPMMASANPYLTKWGVAGDIRANENILLASLHILFVREHNRLCDQLADQYPNWNDEQLYQRSRKLVGAIIQSIVYNEWLPAMGVDLGNYPGYDSSVNPQIMNVFSAAAYRFGHTVISSDILRVDDFGQEIPEGHIKLRDAFFNPDILTEEGGVDPLFRGMSKHVQQDFDTRMIDDLRNFLFGPPGAGGMDLAAMNMQRGRDRGLPDYNAVRTHFGLPSITSFEYLTSDPYMNNLFKNVYQDIHKIDPWVGLIAEDHIENSLFGETVFTIVSEQFSNLRTGDRFYYQNDPALVGADITFIESSTLAEVIKRNTHVSNIQDNVFFVPAISTGIADYTPTENLQLAPNPSSGIFTMSSDVLSAADYIEIINSQGQLIKVVQPNYQNTITIDLTDQALPSGLYVTRVITADNIYSSKILLTK